MKSKSSSRLNAARPTAKTLMAIPSGPDELITFIAARHAEHAEQHRAEVEQGQCPGRRADPGGEPPGDADHARWRRRSSITNVVANVSPTAWTAMPG